MGKVLILLSVIIILFVTIWVVINKDDNKKFTEEGLVKVFNKNHSMFEKITDEVTKNKANFSVFVSDKSVTIDVFTIDEGKKLDKKIISNEVLNIINKLKFSRISCDKDYIVFTAQHGEYENGIVYCRNNQPPTFFSSIKQLQKPNWYTYITTVGV